MDEIKKVEAEVNDQVEEITDFPVQDSFNQDDMSVIYDENDETVKEVE